MSGLPARGATSRQFARDLLAHLRQLLVIRTAGDAGGAFTVTAADPERLRAQAQSFTDIGLARAIDSIAAALAAVREGDEPRMTVELAILRAARPSLDPSREAIMQRLERIEAVLGGGGVAGIPPASGSAEDSQRPPTTPPAADKPSPEERRPPQPPSAEAGEKPEAEVAEPVALERLRDLWPAVVDQLRDSGQELLSTLLEAARPVAVEDGAVRLGFPPAAAFNKRKAEGADARDRVAEAIQAIAGERLRPIFVMLEGEEAEAAASETASALSPEELVERFKAEFDAEELEDAEPETNQEPKEATG